MANLPIIQFEEKIVETVEQNPVVVIIGETGSGKSTQLSQILHRKGYTRSGIIAVTQPRRVAAVSVSRRVAQELGVRLGEEVGYAIRFEDRTSEKTCIKYLIDGVLLRESLSNPELNQYSVIILDEAHERSLNTDILLGLMKRLIKMRASNLKVLITSATLDGEKVSRLFSNYPILNVPGKLFPVEIFYNMERPKSYLESSLKTAIGQLCTPRSLFNTSRAKRKRSPQPSINSSTAENKTPYPARMANDNDDFKMWGSEIVKIFLQILVEEIKKEGPSMSKKDRSFFPRQWQTIDDEMSKKVGKNYGQKKLKGKFARLKANYKEFVALKNHTGLGWDPITQTVTAPDDVWENYVQAHPNAKQFQTKGLEHYELMSEIFAKSFATGAFARSSRQGAPTSDDEREMDERFHAYTSGKGVVDESCSSGSKRKSSGQGQSSKNQKMDDALQSWQRSCEARERFYLQAEANAGAGDAYSVAACMTILKSMALEPSLVLKAMNMFTSLEWRTMFMTMEPEMRYLWILSL